jgi:lysophospholipase L1-like esterase
MKFRIPALLLCASIAAVAAPVDKKLVVAGSSVPKGVGTMSAGTYLFDFNQDGGADDFGIYGYAGRLRLLLTVPANPALPGGSTTAWTFENVSIAGNDTADLRGRFDPDVTRQYLAPKTPGAEPEYVLIALSMGNEGLATTTDPESVLTTYRTGMLDLIQKCRDRGYYPIVTLVYSNGDYTLEKYGHVRRMNLEMNGWDVPSINLLGALDDGEGRWADGFFFDDGHPNFLGHAELFHAIPPTLFDALEAGKTAVPQFPSQTGFARLSRDPAEAAPLAFAPSHRMRSFVTSFRVRSGSAGTVAAVRTTTSPLFQVDFGPSDDASGRATSGTDAFGRRWTNWRPVGSGTSIPAGTTLAAVVDALAGSTNGRTSGISLSVTGGFSGAFGRSAGGGLSSPQVPLLGSFAVGTATEDYFFAEPGVTGTFVVAGLNPSKRYTFRMFASGTSLSTRKTRFAAAGSLAEINYRPFADIVASGSAIGNGGLYHGNDDAIAQVGGLQPDGSGAIAVAVGSEPSGSRAHINALEVLEHGATNRFGTVELRSGAIAYVAPDGREIVAAVDGTRGAWHDIALSHRYAYQQTSLYVDGVWAGSLRETLEPDLFVLGGPAGSGRAAAPVSADFQDWAVHRAAWHRGELQRASLEILAPLDDAAFVSGSSAANAAQSLAQVRVQSGSVAGGGAEPTPGPLAAVSCRSTSVGLSWVDGVVGESGYAVERRVAGSGDAWAEVALAAAGATAHTDGSLAPGVVYEYRVAAVVGGLRGAYSNIASVAAGSDGESYREWAGERFALPPTTYRIDFNSNASAPDYGGEIWNRVSSLAAGSTLALVDAGGESRGGVRLAVAEGFDEFRSGNGNPLAGYDDNAQSTFMAVTDQKQAGGARLVFSGLNRGAVYQCALFARRNPTVAGFDYRGRYTFSGGGQAVSFEANAASAAQLATACLPADAAGNLELAITGPDQPNGSVFAGVSFLTLREVPEWPPAGAFLVDLNASASVPTYPVGQAWNRISGTAVGAPGLLVDRHGSSAAGHTCRVAAAFAGSRENGSAVPNGLAPAAERTMFQASGSGSALAFGGLDPGRLYDLVVVARRGAIAAGFDYSAVFTGSGATVATAVLDGGLGSFATLPSVQPTASGTITLTVAPGPGSGTDFPVLNLVMLVPAADGTAHDPEADPDGDGWANWVEYSRGSDPHVAEASGAGLEAPAFSLDGTRFEASYVRSRGARQVEYVVESTADLADAGSWQADAGVTQSVVATDGALETVAVARALGSDPKRFFRLRLALDPPEL